MSVSDDVSDELGGGTLQLWRVNDLIYRDEAEVLAELDKHRQVVLSHHSACMSKVQTCMMRHIMCAVCACSASNNCWT